MTLSDQVADFVLRLRYDDLPVPVIDKFKDHLFHHIGLALAGTRSPEGSQGVRLAGVLGGGHGPCTVIGSKATAAPLEATLANASLMRADGLDDVLFPVGVHAGLVTLPIALALGEERRMSGREVLTAVVAGYEVIGKLGRPVWAWSAAAPRRPTIPFGPFGAVAVAARLLGLDRTQAANAIGYGAFSAMGLAEQNLVTHYYGLVARNGLTGALIAREGGMAVPTALEGRFGFFRTFFGGIPDGLDESVAALGREFEFMNATTKRYPGTALNIVPIQLTLDLLGRYDLRAGRVRSLKIQLPVERENFDAGHAAPPFRTRQAAASSVRFQVASVVVNGRIDPTACERYEAADVAAVAERTSVDLVAGHPIRYARVVVATEDGRELAAEGDDYVFPRHEWAPWLTEQSDGVLPPDRLARVVELAERFEALDDVSELMSALRPDAG